MRTLNSYTNQEIVVINGIYYYYSAFYKRLEMSHESIIIEDAPHIVCPICFKDKFKLKYNIFEINAIYDCGHQMTVYDG